MASPGNPGPGLNKGTTLTGDGPMTPPMTPERGLVWAIAAVANNNTMRNLIETLRSPRGIADLAFEVKHLRKKALRRIGLTGGHESRLIGLAYLSMFIPTLSVVIVSFAMSEGPRIRWDRFPLRYVPIALFLIPAVLHAVMLPELVALEGPIQWQDWLTPQGDGLYHTPASRGWGILTISGLVGHIVLNGVIGLAANSVMAFFEEVGWRGWLLPRLWDRFGARRAVILTAMIWGFWHVPFQLSGIQHIEGVSPLTLAMIFPFGIMINGLIIGWLWLRTQSIWLVALAHGALNNWGTVRL